MLASLPVGVLLNFGWEWGDLGAREFAAPLNSRRNAGSDLIRGVVLRARPSCGPVMFRRCLRPVSPVILRGRNAHAGNQNRITASRRVVARGTTMRRFLQRTRLRILLLRIVAGRPPTLRKIQKSLKA